MELSLVHFTFSCQGIIRVEEYVRNINVFIIFFRLAYDPQTLFWKSVPEQGT